MSTHIHLTTEFAYDHFLAERVKSLQDSGIRKIFSRAALMENCIDLSIGRTDFDVPDAIKRSAHRAIDEGFNRYTPSAGIPQLREAIRSRIERQHGVACDSVVITSGVSGGLVLAFMALINPGDEVLITDPHFIIHKVLVEQFGGVPVFFDTHPDFRLRRENIEPLITPRTKMIVINTPQNPTGVCYSREELRMIAELATEHYLFILSDEVYERFDYDGEYVSAIEMHPNTVVVSGFTKSFGMAGWRVAYAVGPKPVIDKMITLQQFTFVCAPAPFQKACAENIDIDLHPYIDHFRQKRDFVYESLKDHYALIKPAGSLYAYLEVPWRNVSGTEFIEACLDRSLLLVPGIAFSQQDTHFRLCFGAPDEELEAGVEILVEMARM